MDIEQLQSQVAAHDAEGWQHPPGPKTDDHNGLHLMKTAGRIAEVLEARQDGVVPPEAPIDPKYIADLAIEALRFANNGRINLGEAVAARLVELGERNRARNNL